VHDPGAAVAAVRAPFDQTFAFEAVDGGRDRTAG
jgi:hypothetical protein